MEAMELTEDMETIQDTNGPIGLLGPNARHLAMAG